MSSRLPRANPGPAEQGSYGGVSDQMIGALAYVAGQLTGIPSYVKTALNLVPMALPLAAGNSAARATVDVARTAVAAVAPAMTVAVRLYRVALGPAAGGVATVGVKYPAGSITAYFGGKWHVAIPVGTQLGESAFTIEGATLSGGGGGGGHGHHGGGHGGSYGGRWHGGGYYPVPYAVPACQCPNNHAPVTGTDGKVYENVCWAACAGAAKVTTPGGIAGLSGVGDMADFTCETCSVTRTGLSGGATHADQGVVPTQPAGPTVVAEPAFNKATGAGAVYTKPWFWLAVGGAVVLTGGAYLALRRKRR